MNQAARAVTEAPQQIGSMAAAENRALVCWDACEGIADPVKAIAMARDALCACLENMEIRRAAGVESGPTIERLIERTRLALVVMGKHLSVPVPAEGAQA